MVDNISMHYDHLNTLDELEKLTVILGSDNYNVIKFKEQYVYKFIGVFLFRLLPFRLLPFRLLSFRLLPFRLLKFYVIPISHILDLRAIHKHLLVELW